MANSEQMKMLLNQLSQKLSADSSEVESAVNSGKFDNVIKNLPQNQKNKVEEILKDPQKAQQVLNTPAAQALLKKLMG